MAAHEQGCILDGWNDHFDKEKWTDILNKWDMDFKFFSDRDRSTDEFLPWDMIDPYITKEFLISEYERSKEAVTTKDCRKGCNNCGMMRVINCFGEGSHE